jgi:hypothetical protein
MIKLSVTTKLNNEKIIEKAVDFFGNKNGLKVTEQGDCCASFEGAGGYVRVDIAENEKKEVTVEGREHEYLVKKFVESL